MVNFDYAICWKSTKFSSTIHIDFVLLFKMCQPKNPNMRINVRYSFAFILRISFSFHLTHLTHTHLTNFFTLSCTLNVCRISLFIYNAECSFSPVYNVMCMGSVCYDKKKKEFVLDNEHENTLSCLRIALMCWTVRLTDNGSKRRKGAIIYQMITKLKSV